jgi:hypothetical protein
LVRLPMTYIILIIGLGPYRISNKSQKLIRAWWEVTL